MPCVVVSGSGLSRDTLARPCPGLVGRAVEEEEDDEEADIVAVDSAIEGLATASMTVVGDADDDDGEVVEERGVAEATMYVAARGPQWTLSIGCCGWETDTVMASGGTVK